ncbi:Asp-tRNA(Asn)/Glu-tRNA(Gln) amidotransferase subunit GatB [bacterium (Candidatus Gribaldobacteria) CG_4_10_14_0_8_um_filter_33_9]|uniref:Aspartyl/glutamyl-tRNA(Asn/Gln) amidotransferase subunit B n=1 Tax=bacterium (Candidatus Gribaldobacteria) CG_4_10_14_0_8_um_filter_33_9 TaxID=2014266 RepID=A0A2M7RN97_9BACT|nr:MAG: Asp-tRNA(Asn)/Glu-tRNA(Gln) amidotransferase subunit GatB [bacterium (Candidatus Gribaldobacteria) CG_4_10_14_0_8_um_filter_33_9]
MHKPTIGLEIHAELATNSKMFCSCKNAPGEKIPNINVCPICLGHPGTLPVINKTAIRKAVKTGLALNCAIEKNSYFERKNYFYPDLPKGYQISQYKTPLCRNGYLEIPLTNSFFKKIRIERVHMEEDTGRLIHPEGADYSLIDFNRAGIPLMEIVTEPDIESGQEAREFTRHLQLILKYLNVSSANMEKGEMRCEVNISLSNSEKLGTKVEIKNLNSLKVVGKAIEYEIKRQTDLLEKGEKIIQETRGWHDKKEITISQREKEGAHDYRYFPEPDLPPLELSREFLEDIKKEIVELPLEKMERFKKQYCLIEKEADIYIWQKDLGDYFEKVALRLKQWIKEKKGIGKAEQNEPQKIYKLASNYISTDLQGLLQGKFVNDKNFLITPEKFAEFVIMIYASEISSKIAKVLLKEMYDTGGAPAQIIDEKGLIQISSAEELKEIVKQVIDKNFKPAQDYKNGKETALQFLIGQAMAQTKGKANPETVSKLFKELL